MPQAQAAEVVVEACHLLSSEQPIATREVAQAVGLSDSYFQRCFNKHLGVTPQQYRRRVLAERARDAISEAGSVTESIYEAGYSASSRFYDGVGRELGMRPSVAHAGGVGERIQYSFGLWGPFSEPNCAELIVMSRGAREHLRWTRGLWTA